MISRKPLERRTIVQVIRHRHPRIVDQDFESIDGVESRLDLSPVSHIEHHGHDAPVRICERLSRSDVDALCTSAERLVDERLPEAAIGACHQDGLACESLGPIRSFSGSIVLRLRWLRHRPYRKRTGSFGAKLVSVGVMRVDRQALVGDAGVSEGGLSNVRPGDESAFRELVEPYRRELHLHCYRLLGSLQDAEDIMQETLLAAWRGLSGFEERASLRTWLYRIATNRCLNALRDRRRQPQEVASMAEPPRPTWLAEQM